MTTATGDVDLLVLGGGVMGLFTAYHASAAGASVAVLDSGTIGDPLTASFGRTRSYRRDYLDPLYVRYADEAIGLWGDFERETGSRALVRCGCLNIAAADITPDLDDTYSQRTADVMAGMGMAPETLDAAGLATAYPYLRADVGHLDPTAGLVDLAAVTDALRKALADRGVDVSEQITTDRIVSTDDAVTVHTSAGPLRARALVITAGHGSNGLLAAIENCTLQVPITKDRPSEARYFTPAPDERHRYTSDAMPVMAYLDTGVYVHPIVDGVIDAVKIGYYNPPDIPRDRTGIADVADFVAKVMPGLQGAPSTPVLDVDQCYYDLVADDDFVMGPVPGTSRVHLGVGWRGTGYKFAPWVGATMARLALTGTAPSELDRFAPSRFLSGGAP